MVFSISKKLKKEYKLNNLSQSNLYLSIDMLVKMELDKKYDLKSSWLLYEIFV